MTSSACVVTHFNLYLRYLWTSMDHSYTKMTGLMSTFQKKIVLGHDVICDVTNDVITFFHFFQREITFFSKFKITKIHVNQSF